MRTNQERAERAERAVHVSCIRMQGFSFVTQQREPQGPRNNATNANFSLEMPRNWLTI